MLRRFALSVALVMLVGCSQKLPTLDLHPVHGKVARADGTPLTGGEVSLVPKDKKKGVPCTAKITKNGTFHIFTGRTPGAVPGTYLVAVSPPIVNGSPDANFEKFPEKYGDITTSEIMVDVKSGDNDVGTITLK